MSTLVADVEYAFHDLTVNIQTSGDKKLQLRQSKNYDIEVFLATEPTSSGARITHTFTAGVMTQAVGANQNIQHVISGGNTITFTTAQFSDLCHLNTVYLILKIKNLVTQNIDPNLGNDKIVKQYKWICSEG